MEVHALSQSHPITSILEVEGSPQESRADLHTLPHGPKDRWPVINANASTRSSVNAHQQQGLVAEDSITSNGMARLSQAVHGVAASQPMSVDSHPPSRSGSIANFLSESDAVGSSGIPSQPPTPHQHNHFGDDDHVYQANHYDSSDNEDYDEQTALDDSGQPLHKPKAGQLRQLAKLSGSGVHIYKFYDPEAMAAVPPKTIQEMAAGFRAKAPKQIVRAFAFAGVAPSRFNLRKMAYSKYATYQSTLPAVQHSSATPDRDNGPGDQGVLDGEADAADGTETAEIINHDRLPYTFSVRQGFKFRSLLRHKHQFLSVVHHVRVPVHFADGSLGHEADKDSADTLLQHQYDSPTKPGDDDDVEDVFDDAKGKSLAAGGNGRVWSIASIDRNKVINVWDLAKLGGSRPRVSKAMDHEISQIVFLSRHAMYAAIVDLKTIKFFTSKMDFTSGVNAPHPVQILRYSARFNELLNAVHQKGVIRIEPTLRVSMETKLGRDEWIDDIYLDEKNKQIWAIVDVHIMIIDYMAGQMVEYVQHVTSRKISCLTIHDAYQYTLIGSVDGTIKVMNIARAIVHEFVSHTKGVTGIAIYPYGPLILSCGLDYCVRMYNLKSFKEIFSKSMPSRVVIRTSDGVIRLLCPINGRTITATLPLLETDAVKDIAYFPALNRLYVMLSAGEIWTFRTDANPCTIVDIWRLVETTAENCTKIVAFEGVAKDQTQSQLRASLLHPNGNGGSNASPGTAGPQPPETYGFLFGATSNGHLLVYGKGGVIIDRYQLHLGPIQQLICDSEQQVIVSSGKDEAIRVSRIYPMHESLVQIEVAIKTNFVPRLICVMNNIICASAEDATLHMFEFNLEKKEWRVVPGHSKTDDHTDGVTAICCIPKLSIFISIGRDATMRVWNQRNALIREIQFQEQIDGLCVANPRGDLLIAMHNRIDIVRNSSYMPPNYLRAIEQLTAKTLKAEQPLAFDDSLIPFTRSPEKVNKRRPQRLDRSDPASIFRLIDLYQFDKDEPEFVPSFGIDLNTIDFTLPVSTDEGAVAAGPIAPTMVVARRGTYDDALDALSQKYRMRLLMAQDTAGHGRDHANAVSADDPTKGDVASARVDMLADGTVQVGDSSIGAVAVTDATSGQLDVAGSGVQGDQQDPSLRIRKRGTRYCQHADAAHADSHLVIAPDGQVPNSGIVEEVNTWLRLHDKQPLNTQAVHSYKKQKAAVVAVVDDSKRMRSEQYKAKLKELMMQMPRDEKAEEPPPEEPTEAVEEEDEEEMAAKLRLQRRLNAANHEIVQQTLEVKLSPLIEKMMDYSWFPDDEIFYPANSGLEYDAHTIITNSKGNRMRKTRIEGTTDAIIPIILRIMAKSSPQIRVEISQYINWINEEFGFRDSTLLERQYCRQLQENVTRSFPSEELQLRLRMIDSLLELNPNNPEIVPTLLLYSDSMYDQLKFKAIQVLRSMGAPCIETQHITAALKKLFDQAAESELSRRMGMTPSTDGDNPSQAGDLRTLIVEFLRENLRSYLSDTCRDKEMSKKLRLLSIYGLEERKRATERKERAAKQQKKKKGSRPTSAASNQGDLKRPTSPAANGKAALDGRKGKAAAKNALLAKGQPKLGRSAAQDDYHPQVHKPGGAGGASGASKLAHAAAAGDIKAVETSPDAVNAHVAKAIQVEELVMQHRTKEYETSLDVLRYPQLPIPKLDRTHGNKPPIFILQDPAASDFIDALNYYITTIELRIELVIRQTKEREYQESEAAEKARRDAEARAKFLQFKAQKAAERQARDQARNARIAALRRGDLGTTDPTLPKSHCHHSRESLDLRLHLFPPITPENASHFHGSMSVHLQTYNKSMPLEQVNIRPFGGFFDSDTKETAPSGDRGLFTAGSSGGMDSLRSSRPPTRPLSYPSSRQALMTKPMSSSWQRQSRPASQQYFPQSQGSYMSQYQHPQWKPSSGASGLFDSSDAPVSELATMSDLQYIRGASPLALGATPLGSLRNTPMDARSLFGPLDAVIPEDDGDISGYADALAVPTFKPGRRYFVHHFSLPTDPPTEPLDPKDTHL
ncbi:hypothetical protein BC831DRAFT_445429 [Entophlyctis helioformis]|nr:hypothetical protein BC831DRAFT_445429 [Entophlyctis helioformis]